MSNFRKAALALLVTLAALTAGSQELEAQSIRFQAPAGFRVDPPVLNSGSGYSYTVAAQWEYSDVRISTATGTGSAPTWEFVVDWDGTEVSAGHNLAASRTFTTSGPVDVKVRLEVSCPSSATGTTCKQINIYGVNYRVSKGETWASTWSETQTVLLPVADDQYPTRVTEEEAPPAIVDALGAVFGAIGVQDPDAKAHLWSIFICLMLAIGLAATCFGSTGGGPASVFLGAVAFFLVFSLAGPPAFGVPGVFAGLALLVPSLGLVVFAKTKVR